MDLYLTNTLTRKKEAFTPIESGKVGLYSCGPTVYYYAHIGNLRAFTFADILRRTLMMNGYEVMHVMNITDVGHLVGDGDDGEDKLEKGAKRDGKTAWEIAQFYTDAFMRDMAKLNILTPNKLPRATEHIEEQIQMIEDLEKNGYAYRTSDGVYFDTSKLETYGRLSGQKIDEKEEGARIGIHSEKKNLSDFALWKLSVPGAHSEHAEGSKRQMEWESPWGVGFPGWHIECSAMSTAYLGHTFDIHTGGIDHIPVHHENELAQTEGAFGTLQAKYWLHNEFVQIDGGKMSKSLGNAYALHELEERGFDPLAFRYFVLGAHYRSSINFTFDALEAAQNALKSIRSMVREFDPHGGAVDEGLYARFQQAMNDDLNTPVALAVLHETVKNDALPLKTKAATVRRIDQVLGLGLEDYIGRTVEAPLEVLALVEAREKARKEKHWEESDRLRDEIKTLGFVVRDGEDGPELQEV
ncbi:MAG: cysteine--tRNA ligase [bacterium]|nr:cysteine--tRNA ligase [bacterium]